MNQFIFYVFFLIVANVLLNNFFLYKDYIFSDSLSLNNTVIINKNLRNNCCIDNSIDNSNIHNTIIRYYLRQVE
jgi:hypothetical protein